MGELGYTRIAGFKPNTLIVATGKADFFKKIVTLAASGLLKNESDRCLSIDGFPEI